MTHHEPISSPVAAAFDRMDPAHRAALHQVRALIFEVAQADPRIGEIEEALRWGEPAYLTRRGKTGSTIRLAVEKGSGQPALFFNCKTTLVEGFRQQFATRLRYVKNRAVLLDGDIAEDAEGLKSCIAAALTYHLDG